MSKEWDTIPGHLVDFAVSQKVFFIASVAGDDDVNLSPKGVAPLRVIDGATALYADYNGSGNQTAKHLAAGGRATLVFMSFDDKPLILRFYATGKVLEVGTPLFSEMAARYYPDLKASEFRRIFLFNVHKAQTSCGFGVPRMEHIGDRSSEKYFRELLEPYQE